MKVLIKIRVGPKDPCLYYLYIIYRTVQDELTFSFHKLMNGKIPSP